MRPRAWAMASGLRPSSARTTFSVPTRSGAVSTNVPSRSKAMTAPESAAALSAAIDDLGRLVEVLRIRRQRHAGDAHVLLGVVVAPFLDGLAHAGQGLGAIAGELAGRIDHVHVPGPAGQTLLAQQALLQGPDDRVELGFLGLAEAGAL